MWQKFLIWKAGTANEAVILCLFIATGEQINVQFKLDGVKLTTLTRSTSQL